MMRTIAAIIGCALLTAMAGCGNGDGTEDGSRTIEEGVRVVLEADLSDLPEGSNANETMDDVREVLERRLKAFGADYEIRVERANQLSVTVADVSPQEAREVIGKTARLEFRKPVVDGTRSLVCHREDGTTYTVGYDPGGFVQLSPTDLTCPAEETGEPPGLVQWEPATGTDSQGEARILTGSYLRPNASVVDTPSVAVLIEFTGEGSLLFEQITGELVGLPLAIFLDDDMIGAPTVQQAISGGQASVTGLTAEEAKRLAILLNAGALPVPVRAVSEEVFP